MKDLRIILIVLAFIALQAHAQDAGTPSLKTPGSTGKACAVCPEMVRIQAGSFRMGDADETPVHTVTIETFALGKYEVTFAEYDAFARATNRSLPSDQGWGRGTRPVINVSWEDAKAYVGWLATNTGLSFRLPSEAEWEYAARAGTETAYSWGDAIGRNQANCIGCGSAWDNKQTAPVGSFAANAFGFHDMHGNVWEWVEDCYHSSYRKAPATGQAWTSGECTSRVRRGGSWYFNAVDLRSAKRSNHAPDSRHIYVGFRVAQNIQ